MCFFVNSGVLVEITIGSDKVEDSVENLEIFERFTAITRNKAFLMK